MLFLRLLSLRRRWREANDTRALSVAMYHHANLEGARALGETYYADAQRAEARMDRAAVEMLKLGAEPHMRTGALLAVAWRHLPLWLRTGTEIVAILLVCVLASINLP
jgi:hypothetical protein